jgi:hypothetical protein
VLDVFTWYVVVEERNYQNGEKSQLNLQS